MVKKKEKAETFCYEVEINSECEYSERSDEEYGDWSESYHNTFSFIKKHDNNDGNFHSQLNLKRGDKVFVVWLSYTNGDSFGSATNGRTEVLEICSSRSDAELIESVINLSEDDRENVNALLSDNRLFSVYPFWNGFFESLGNVYIEETTIL